MLLGSVQARASDRCKVNGCLRNFSSPCGSIPATLHRLPLDKIKVDRSFVADIETQLSQRLVASVLDLCENLDNDCVIEGAETADQAQILRKLGCATMHGYHFGRPVPEQQVAALLAARSRAAPAAARARHSA